jgi:Phosphotransferase enzyme family
VESHRDVIEFLRARKLVRSSSLIEDGFHIEDVSRRNCNLRIEVPHAPGYFVKIATDPERKHTLAREARTYRFLRSGARGVRCRAVLPRVRLFDREASVLVLELLDRENLKTRCIRRRGFAIAPVRRIARALARLHRQLSMAAEPRTAYRVFCPMPFDMPHPTKAFLQASSPASVQMLRIVRDSELLSERLTQLAQTWKGRVQAQPSLIHGDLRLDNCCVAAGSTRIRIVDWELAGVGDPLWDAGAVLADLASAWLMSAPTATGSEPAAGIPYATIPIESLRSAGREFWGTYAAACGLAGDGRAEALRNTMDYVAARLLQLTYEHLQGDSSLTVHAIGHCQLSENLMRLPMDGAAQILGIAA